MHVKILKEPLQVRILTLCPLTAWVWLMESAAWHGALDRGAFQGFQCAFHRFSLGAICHLWHQRGAVRHRADGVQLRRPKGRHRLGDADPQRRGAARCHGAKACGEPGGGLWGLHRGRAVPTRWRAYASSATYTCVYI